MSLPVRVRATAFIMPSRGTTSGMMVWRVTVSKARAIPTAATSANTCQTSSSPLEASPRIISAESANPARTAWSSRLRSYLSTTIP